MAQAMVWYRAYHGTVADPVFGVVAARSKQRRGDVITMWHYLLEEASASSDRGNPGRPDFEAIDLLLGMDEGGAKAIYVAMVAKGLVVEATGRLEAWDRRQPKRERDDASTSTSRVQAFRDRKRQLEQVVTGNDGETPGNANDVSETPREEKRRGEEGPHPDGCGESESTDSAPQQRRAGLPDCPHQRILALWAEVLPALPQHNPDMWDGARADHLRARWRETAQAKGWQTQEDGLRYFRKLFGYIGKSPFLTGNAKPRSEGARPFVAELEWILTPSKWARLHEGKYHDETATQEVEA